MIALRQNLTHKIQGEEMKTTVNMVIVNAVTCSRFFLAIAALYAMYRENWIIAAITFFCGLATDWIDGALARKLNAATKFGGEVLEPIADVFLMMCGAVGLVVIGLVPWWALVAVIVANRVLDWGVRPHITRPDRVLWFEAVVLEAGAYGISVFLLWQANPYAGITAICTAPIIITLKRRRIRDFTRWCWR